MNSGGRRCGHRRPVAAALAAVELASRCPELRLKFCVPNCDGLSLTFWSPCSKMMLPLSQSLSQPLSPNTDVFAARLTFPRVTCSLTKAPRHGKALGSERPPSAAWDKGSGGRSVWQSFGKSDFESGRRRQAPPDPATEGVDYSIGSCLSAAGLISPGLPLGKVETHQESSGCANCQKTASKSLED